MSFQQEALISSPYISSYLLLWIRFGFMIFFIIACYFTYVERQDDPVHILNTLSFQTMLANAFFFLLIIVFTFCRCATVADLSNTRYDSLSEHHPLTFSMKSYRQWMPYIIYMAWDVLVPTSFFVTLIYWGLSHDSVSFSSIAMHLTNSVAFGFELAITRILPSKGHIFVLWLLASAFLVHMYFYYETLGIFIYEHFDFEEKMSNIVIWPGSVVFLTLLFFSIWGIQLGKSVHTDDFAVYVPVSVPEVRFHHVEMKNFA